MATKDTRLQSRRTTVAGRVPTASDLLTGELGLNLTDRKMYSKDASENVFQISAEPGRGVGQAAVFENLDGTGYPVLNADDRRYYRRLAVTPGRFADHIFVNDPSNLVGGAEGQVDHVVLVAQTIDKTVSTYQWGLGSHVFVRGGAGGDPNGGAAGGGQHCSMNAQVFVEANCSVFALNTNVVDRVLNPTAGRVSYEAGMGITGPDPNRMRFVMTVNIGPTELDPETQQGAPGDNRVSRGISVGPTNGDSSLAQFTNALFVEGKNKSAVNLSYCDVSWGDGHIVSMPSGGDIVWTDPDQYVSTPTPKMRIGYNPASARQTLKITGIRRASGGNVTVGPQSDYLILDTESGPVAIPSYSITAIS